MSRRTTRAPTLPPVRDSSLHWSLILSLSVLSACGSPPETKAPVSPAPTTTATSATPATPARPEDAQRDQLVHDLRALPGADVLGALGPKERAALDQNLGEFNVKERDTLAQAGNPVIGVRPLLHLLAGGNEREAYLRLALSPAAVEELTAAQMQGSAMPDLTELLKVAPEVARRAAQEALHQSAALLAASDSPDPLLLDEVRECARVANLPDIALRAAELSYAVAPGRARGLVLASMLATSGKAADARAAFEAAKKHEGVLPKQFEQEMEWRVVAAEQIAASNPPGSLEEAVALARAQLTVEATAAAAATLEPYTEQANTHLALAVALARTRLEGSVCPGFPNRAGSIPACSAAWKTAPATAEITAMLEAAWKSGQGRDAEAAEGYLGFVHVVPWMYGQVAEGAATPQERARVFLKRLDEFLAAARAARDVDASFEGVELFVTVLRDGFLAGAQKRPGQRVELARNRRAELTTQAIALGQNHSDRFAHAGALAVAALLAQDDDVLPILRELKGDMQSELLRAYAVLRVWTAATRTRIDVAIAAGKDLNELVSMTDPSSLDRSQLVLLMAETEVSLLKTDKTANVLRHVVEPLLNANVELVVKLQAAVDLAALNARAGKREEAINLLTQIVTGAAPEQLLGSERDLWTVAKAYLLILRAEDATGAERRDYRKRLSEHLKASQLVAPASIQAWIRLWEEELQNLSEQETCAGQEPCVSRVAARSTFQRQQLDTSVGAEAARLMRKGTLGAGTLNLSFSFSGNGKLLPVVSLEPRLLVVPFPARFLKKYEEPAEPNVNGPVSATPAKP